VPEQRLLSPEICLRRRRSCGTVLGKTSTPFRVFRPEASYRQRGVVRGQPGAPHTRVARPGPRPRHLCVRVASDPPSGSLSVFGKLPGKIRLLAFVTSNSENISCVAFPKHKNSRKQGTGTMASCQ
jgi:hypothetical protein